jgi:hypothetical protein
MATDTAPSFLRGLALMDPRIGTGTWAAESSFTQAGPYPGIPQAQGNYDLVLQSSGTQAAAKALRIKTMEGGHPEPGGAAFIWQEDGDTLWRGHDAAGSITDWEHILWTDGGVLAATKGTKDPHAITLDDGTIVLASQEEITGNNHRIMTRTRSPSTGTWSAAVVVHSEAPIAPGVDYSPCLVALPDGAILLFHWLEDTINEEAQVRMHISTDDGATWTVGASAALKTPVDISSSASGWVPGRLRAAYAAGQVLMVGQAQSNDPALTSRQLWLQWGSTSNGAQFDTVEIPTSSVIYMGGLDIVAHRGLFHVLFTGGSSDDLALRTCGSAYEKLSTVVETTISAAGNFADLSGAVFTDVGDCTLVIDDASTMWAYARSTTGSGDEEGIVMVSRDLGSSWRGVGTGPGALGTNIGQWWAGHDGNAYPTNYAATYQGGRVVLFHNWTAAAANEDDSLGAFYLGGYSTLTMPGLRTYRDEATQAGWIRNWIPIELPGDTGWTAAGVGAEDLDVGALDITTAGNFKHYTTTVAGSPTPANGAIIRATLQMVAGGGLTGDRVAIRLGLEDGASGYEIKLRAMHSPPKLRFVDSGGGVQIGSDISLSWDQPIDVVIAMKGASASMWWRQSSTDGDRVWNVGPTTGALVSSGGGGTSEIQWGHRISSTSQSKWTELHYAAGASAGLGLGAGQVNPDDLHARTFAGVGSHQWIDGGTRITAVDGPTRVADLWHIDTGYRHELANIFPVHSPTPRVAWRSTGVGSEDIAIPLDATLLGTAAHRMGNQAVALTLLDINWRLGTWEGYNQATSTWDTIASIDAASGLAGLSWSRHGNTVGPAGGASSGQYLHQSEFDGCTFDLNGDLRRITSTWGGSWTGTQATKQASLFLDGVTGAEAASGAANGSVWAKDLCIVVALTGDKRFSGYRLRITAGSTVDGFQKIGTAIMGPVAYFGTQYSWGRTTETAVNVAAESLQDGQVWTRVAGPAARRVDFAWTDGIDTSSLNGASPDPDYFTATASGSAEGVATVKAVPQLIDGLVRQLDGPHTPVVYLPRVPRGPSDVVTLNRRGEFMAGRMSGAARVESILGDEGDTTRGEMVRVATISIDELV